MLDPNVGEAFVHCPLQPVRDLAGRRTAILCMVDIRLMRWRETVAMGSLVSGALRLSASRPLPIGDVWERYSQPRWWRQWAPHMREVDYPHAVVTPGTTGRITGVGGVVADFRIDAVDVAAHTWSWSVRSGPFRVSFEHGVDAAPPGSRRGSVAWLVMHGPWPVLLGYVPIARYSLGRLLKSV